MIYKINKKALLHESSIFKLRGLKDDGFVMNAMKNKNRHQIDPNNSVMGPSYNSQSNFARLAKNQNERLEKRNTDQRLADNYNNNSVRPVHSDPIVTNDRNMINANKYNQHKEDTMYAKHDDPFKPLPMNNNHHDQNVIDTPHTLIGH